MRAPPIVSGSMRVYVFGNTDAPEDRRAVEVARQLDPVIDNVSFVFVGPNEEIPFADEGRVVILDTVRGIRDVALIPGDEIDGFVLSPRATVHDFDLAFQLKYLRKIGRLGEVKVIGVPQEGEVDYPRVRSILRKLVAQDMQGS
jgi:Ni,Fe-hydrogenase maturation factor